MRHLAIFDIDGTLTDTNAVDDECFTAAVIATLGLDTERLDWSGAPHITDSSLVEWLCKKYCRRSLRRAEAVAVLERFFELLQAETLVNPARFQPIAGAGAALEYLIAAGWNVALATGGWSDTARLKLRAAGLDVETFPLATASDAVTREEIMQLAVSRATARDLQKPFTRIASVGDAIWDVQAAASLGWPFVGIAVGERATGLRAAGARTVLPDLSDMDRLSIALNATGVPTVVASSVSA